METVQKRKFPDSAMCVISSDDEISVKIPTKKVSKFRDNIEELDYYLEYVNKDDKSDLFESILF